MATLMVVYGKDGSIHGMCDERCYNAKEPECKCVCNGANHSMGLKYARAATERSSEAMIQRYAKRNRLDNYTADVFGNDLSQTSLLL